MENWDIDFIGKRAIPINLPPLRMRKTEEERNAPLKDKRLKALLDIAPERNLHEKSLHILHDVSDVERHAKLQRTASHPNLVVR